MKAIRDFPMAGKRRRPRGFTMVELIVVIMIATILASLSAAVYFRLAANAKVTATESLIAQLDAALKERLDLFYEETRSVAPSDDCRILAYKNNTSNKDDVKKRRSVTLEKLQAMRECFPQQFIDFMRRPTNVGTPADGDFVPAESDPDKAQAVGRQAVSYSGRTAILMDYLRRTNQLVANTFNPASTYSTRPANHVPGTEYAECLYLILSQKSSGATFSIDNVPSQFIADTDGDGLPEFVDSWGKPLRFYRWPTDYVAYLMDITKQLKSPGSDSPGTTVANLQHASNLDPDATLTEIDSGNGWHEFLPLNAGGDTGRARFFEQEGYYRLHPAYDLSQARPFSVSSEAAIYDKTGEFTALKDTRKAYPLLPIIVSSGPDQDFGLKDPAENRAPFRREMHFRGARPDPERAGSLGDNIVNLLIVSGRRQ